MSLKRGDERNDGKERCFRQRTGHPTAFALYLPACFSPERNEKKVGLNSPSLESLVAAMADCRKKREDGRKLAKSRPRSAEGLRALAFENSNKKN